MRKLIALVLMPLAACKPVGDDSTALAKQTIATHCGICHTVPGVAEARGRVGPDLAEVGQRQVIAGRLSNSRDNMLHWITRAQDISPGAAMPNIPLTQQQAEAVVDYLYSLD